MEPDDVTDFLDMKHSDYNSLFDAIERVCGDHPGWEPEEAYEYLCTREEPRHESHNEH